MIATAHTATEPSDAIVLAWALRQQGWLDAETTWDLYRDYYRREWAKAERTKA